MKTIKEILTKLNEQSEGEGLTDLLEDVRQLYIEETGDDDFAQYDVGLQILEQYADEFPEDLQDQIGADLYEAFFADEAEGEEEGDEEDDDELEEGMKVVKKIKKKAAEKREAHKEYMQDKSQIKMKNKKWRRSAAGKKWAAKYAKFKATHNVKKGQRVSTV